MEIRNPAKLPTDLNPAEEKFVRCLAEGKPCIVGNGKLPGPEERIESGDNANVVRGEVIRFFAYGGSEENSVSGLIISLQGAWISGDLDVTHANIPYALMCSNCHFDDFVRMQYAECAGLYLIGSHLARGLGADALTTKGYVFLRDNFFAKGEVRLLGANIGGGLDCNGGKFHNPKGYALYADGLTTRYGVYLNGNFSAEGEVRLLNANIGGDLDCVGGKFHNPDGNALAVDGLTTKGAVYLSKDFSGKGEVRLMNASIGGNLDCVGGKFHNLGGKALSVDNLTTKGDVNLRNGFFAEGEVRLMGANIGGDLSCMSGKFHNPKGHALSADGLTTKGAVYLSKNFSAKGEVRLLSANISGNLDCTGGKFHNPDKNKYALNVDGGNISGGLFWRETACKGNVCLAYARANVLSDDPDSWESCKVDLDGFTYNRFSNPMDAQFRIGWLAKRPDEEEFSPLPYEQVAKVLFGMGHVHDAREILLKKERLLTECGTFPWMWRQGRKIWDVLAGYGYRPWLHTFLISLGIMMIGSGLFCWGEQAGRIAPHQPAALVSSKYQYGRIPAETPDETVARKFSGYPEFSPILFSVDIFVPFLNLHQEPFWYPAPYGGHQHWWRSAEDGEFSWWVLLEGWYWFQIIAGWVLTSLFLLSITGLLRPRQSSGEKD